MQAKGLAARLISAVTDAERRQLLKNHPRLANERLAREIKDICYLQWTAEPAIAQKAAAALRTLSKTVSNNEILAISSWISGISDITQSKFDRASDRFDRAADIFKRIGLTVDAAQTQVAKLIALALLGRYGEADKAGRNALKIFEKADDQLAAGKIEMNLSNIAARRERHAEAEKFALSAHARFKILGERVWMTMAENDLANTYSEINDFRLAEKYFAMAAEGARHAKMRLTQAEIEASLGNLELFRGRFADALRLLELSRQKYDQLKMPHQSAIAELEIAEAYAELNLVGEASSMLVPLAEELRRLKLRAEEARARSLLARLLITRKNYASALKQLTRARRIYLRESNVVGIARTDVLKAGIENARGNYARAFDAADDAISRLADTGNTRLLLAARWVKAESTCLQGVTAYAKEQLQRIVDDAVKNEQPNIAVAALNSLGKLALHSGDVRRARTAFEKATRIIEQMREPIAADEFRMSFLAGQLEPFTELFKIEIDQGRPEKAFAIHEAARARSLADVLSLNSGNPMRSSNKLSRELESLREELNWFYSRLTREGNASDLEAEIASREKKIAQVTRRLNSLGQGHNIRSKAFEVASLLSSVGRDQAFIEYLHLDGRFSAFVVAGDRLHFVKDICSYDDMRSPLEGLRFQFGSLRFGASLSSFLPHLKRNADHYLERLYDKLIKPIESLIGAKRLVIAPSGMLNYVPFNALYDGERYLVEKNQVMLAPSAAVWLALMRKRKHSPRRGALLMAYSDASIPLAEAEVRSIKRYTKNAWTFTGRKATFKTFVENAAQADLIHLACHGQFRSDAPMFSSLHLADGWITVGDLSRQRLNASLVTLSACETGLSEIHTGEEILGLTRGFLSAGARNLIVSLWTVNDEATNRLMADLYQCLQRGDGPAASLRTAQNEFISRGAHPYYWSAFVSIGA
jgi:tetratricopeptide (TPR) repeat protein